MGKPRATRVKRRMPSEPPTPAPRSPKRIEAELSKQAPNNSHSPPLFYQDLEFKCRDCRKREVWTAEQQQWWYEVAKGPIQSTAVRCRACRAARRASVKGTAPKSHKERRLADNT
ncbi:MAG: zinc-ribbon domain containing protein [Tepidisphaeraceae bacterium]